MHYLELGRRILLVLLCVSVVALTACDPNNRRGSDERPIVPNPGNQENRVGDDVSLEIKATDPQGDALNFFASGLPVGLSMNAEGVVTGSPTQEENVLVTVRVDDGKGNRQERKFGWRILPADPTDPVEPIEPVNP